MQLQFFFFSNIVNIVFVYKHRFYVFKCRFKIARLQGDSGGPVLCKHNGHRYLIGISTRVTARQFSTTPQLCFLRIPSGQVHLFMLYRYSKIKNFFNVVVYNTLFFFFFFEKQILQKLFFFSFCFTLLLTVYAMLPIAVCNCKRCKIL